MRSVFRISGLVLSILVFLFSLTGCLPVAEKKELPSCGVNDSVRNHNPHCATKILFVDKTGGPYSGFHFYLESAHHDFLTADQDGEYEVSDSSMLASGLGTEFWWYPMQTPGNDFVGWEPYTQPASIEALGNGTYQVTLSRILFSDGAGDTYAVRTTGGFGCIIGAADCVANTTTRIAQAFVAPNDMDICYVGLGQHGRPSAEPATVGIYTDNAGEPGTHISSGPIVFGNDHLRPSIGAAVTAYLCAGGAPVISLTGGTTYWVVGNYAAAVGANPFQFSYMGSSAPPASGIPAKQSADGAVWTNLPTLMSGIDSLLIFVAQ